MSPSTAIIRRMDSLGKWTVAGVLVAIAFGVAAIVTPELRQFLHLEKKPGEASIPDTPEGATTIPAQAVQLSDLPQDLLNPVQTDSAAELTAQLKQRGSLTLNGSTLTLGSVGAGRTVTIACRTLRLTNGARIITNGNHLVLVALNTRFGDNAGISSFSQGGVKAAPAADGVSGGKVRINVLQSFSGSLHVSLTGQSGGDGAAGGQGSPGRTGDRGANAVKGLVDCHSGGGNGSPGGQGGKGGTGGAGGKGGDGGELSLEGMAASNRNLVDFDAPGGRGGLAGTGGPGGPGGAGGEGGSGDGPCSGGHGGAAGPGGAQGDLGTAGGNGQAGKQYTELQHKNSAPETVRGPAAQPQPSSQPYSNSQLKDAALDLARRLREFQSEFTDSENRILMEQSHITDKAAKEKDFVDRNAKLLAFMNGTQARFVPLRAEAQNMRVQLLNRLPPQEANQTVDMVLNSGALAGPYPLYDVAAYFERLAGLLRP